MASRAVLPENPRVGGGQKKNGEQAEGRNRRALREIGNVAISQAVEGKPPVPTTRPMTRSFGLQLLANAQAAAEKNNCKKPMIEIAKVPHKKKEAVVPKEENVIVISSDEESVKSERKVRDKSSNKSLTSILSARSKAVSGVTKKPRDFVVDIDAGDVDNELAAAEYVEDIYRYYKLTEGDGRVHDYMESQTEINSKMRAILIDWLIEVHRKFELMPESLYLSVNIVDRFLSMKNIKRRELQLVGIGSMLLACKYEEIWAPEVSDFIAICDNAYVREQVLVIEKAILGKLEWYLTVPTPYVFLVRYIKASIPGDAEMENMTLFLAELGLTNYSTMIKYKPSLFAASAVYAARCTLVRTPSWTDTLKHHTGYEEDQLMECAKALVGLHSNNACKVKGVWRKYSDTVRGVVALMPPARALV